ncbi:MAG: hypothetical protein AAGF46_03650, partial [Pseudomonadota bacterium]
RQGPHHDLPSGYSLPRPGLVIDGRFRSQGPKKKGLDVIGDPFDEMHRQLFTFALDNDKEIVNLRAVSQGKEASIDARPLARGRAAPAKKAALGTSTVFVDNKDQDATLYDRSKLLAGNKIAGPAIVLEMDSTTVILPGHVGTVDKFGNILISPTP